MLKICFVASSGGHWEELMCLKELFDSNDVFFITESGGQVQDCNIKKRIYQFKQINRKERFFMDSLLEASEFVQTLSKRQGVTISAPEEIAYVNKWIDKEKLLESAKVYGKSPYGEHLKAVAEGKVRY